MNEIQRQVRAARRRLNLQTFLRVIAVSLTIGFVIALVGVAIPRLWVVPVAPEVWTWSWIGGGAAVGVFGGWLYAFVRRRNDLQAAIELDKRFGLKERVSSSLALAPSERDSDFGQALLGDAQRRVERLDLREQFQLGWNARLLMPCVPMLALFALVMFVPHAVNQATASPTGTAETMARIKKAVAELEKKIALKKEELQKDGLKDADAALTELQKLADKLKSGETGDTKETLVKLNDIAKEAAKRKNELGASENLKKELEKLQKLEQGPGEKLADALREGKLGEAAKEVQKLMEKLQKGELNQEEREKLADQIEQVKNKIEQVQQDMQKQQQALKEEIEKKKNEGNPAEAAKLQEKLEKLQAQEQAMKKNGLNKMAEKMGQCCKNMREGKDGQAAQDMKELSEDLQALKDQLAEAESLNETLEEISDAKQAMNCEKCQGQGCKACQNKNGFGQNKGQGNGDGLGEGRGFGDRPIEETDTKSYDSRVRTKPQKGQAIRVGDAGGANLPGRAAESVKQEVAASLAKEADPIDESSLPRDQREHSREYFEKLLKGE